VKAAARNQPLERDDLGILEDQQSSVQEKNQGYQKYLFGFLGKIEDRIDYGEDVEEGSNPFNSADKIDDYRQDNHVKDQLAEEKIIDFSNCLQFLDDQERKKLLNDPDEQDS